MVEGARRQRSKRRLEGFKMLTVSSVENERQEPEERKAPCYCHLFTQDVLVKPS